ncbi:kinase-like protein [Ramicandelaber brevisporus]|nr:kinase-like protein [Ramicandelaber brevisporus]
MDNQDRLMQLNQLVQQYHQHVMALLQMYQQQLQQQHPQLSVEQVQQYALQYVQARQEYTQYVQLQQQQQQVYSLLQQQHAQQQQQQAQQVQVQQSQQQHPAASALVAASAATSSTPSGIRAPDQFEHNGAVFQRTSAGLSDATIERAANAKLRLEHFYKTAKSQLIDRAQRIEELEVKLRTDSGSDERKRRLVRSYSEREASFLRLGRLRLSLDDFVTIKVIGRGAFGEVRLVQKSGTGKIYALKMMRKTAMQANGQLAHVRAERDILANADSPWVVSLFFSFQDVNFLYLVMEFLPGGDLMTMLMTYDTFSEEMTRFYMAEMVLSIEEVHKLGFIHRDIKPDNVLITSDGHVKLSDFGLATGFHRTHDTSYYQRLTESISRQRDEGEPRTSGMSTIGASILGTNQISLTMSTKDRMATWRRNRRELAYSRVGTPNYLSPEVLTQQGYGQSCDWWSLGIIMFECLYGYPTFCHDDDREVYNRILHWREALVFPDDIPVSPEALDLMRRFICDPADRIGRGGAHEIKSHPFFRGIDWTNIRSKQAPFQPELRSITDTRYFPTDQIEQMPSPIVEVPQQQGQRGSGSSRQRDIAFIGYTYKRFDDFTKRNLI